MKGRCFAVRMWRERHFLLAEVAANATEPRRATKSKRRLHIRIDRVKLLRNAAAGWAARKGKCVPPDFPAEAMIHQMTDGVNMWQRFCTLKGGTGICLPVNMSATLFAWDPDPRLGNAVPLAGQGQTATP